MDVTAEMILTEFGVVLPLDRSRRDALALYARKAAGDAKSKQLWVEKTWDLKAYEAKDLLKGNCSEAVWERILKHKNGGWRVLLPIMGSVIGHTLEDFLHRELEDIANERRELEARETRLRGGYARLRARRSVDHRGLRLVPQEDPGARREGGGIG